MANKVVEPIDCSVNLSLITYCTQNKTVLGQSNIEHAVVPYNYKRLKFKTSSSHVPVLDDALLLNSFTHLHSASRL